MEQKNYLKLGEMKAYKTVFHLSNYIWDIVVEWDWFAKKTVGDQFVRASDSISANIAEGFGRYHKKDKIKLYRYAQGSTRESFDWNEKSKTRGLLAEAQYDHIFKELDKLPKKINSLIKTTNANLTK